MVLIGTGSEVSVCLGARELLAARGLAVRVVSMPSWDLFEAQPAEYQLAVLPPAAPTLAVEAASSFGWSRWADDVIAIDRFGESAPGEVALAEFGYTPENVATRGTRAPRRGHTMTSSVTRLIEFGQSPWNDNLTRALARGGLRDLMAEHGIRGVTSNPTIFEKAMATGSDYDEQLREVVGGGASIEAAYWALVERDIADAADILRGTFDDLGGHDGFVSIEVNPDLAYDTEGTLAQAQDLFGRLARPNVMIKIPATREGLPAITDATAAGLNINVTLIFALERYQEVVEAYLEGLEQRIDRGEDVSGISSVASFFVSRVDTETDRRLPEGHPRRGQAAVANAKLAYRGVPRAVLGSALGRSRRGRREPAAAAVGVDIDEEPCLLPHAVRRSTRRSRHGQHARASVPRGARALRRPPPRHRLRRPRRGACGDGGTRRRGRRLRRRHRDPRARRRGRVQRVVPRRARARSRRRRAN